MKIEYTQKNKFTWVGTLNGDILAVITCVTCGDVEYISIMDYAAKEFINPAAILESINQAKAVCEYHFRHLIEAAETSKPN